MLAICTPLVEWLTKVPKSDVSVDVKPSYLAAYSGLIEKVNNYWNLKNQINRASSIHLLFRSSTRTSFLSVDLLLQEDARRIIVEEASWRIRLPLLQ